MKKILFAFLLLSSFAHGLTCSLSSTFASLAASAGSWTGTGCTGPTFVPGNGDTVTITGATLTLASGESWTIGSSPTSTPGSAGTPAITFGAAGVVIVGSGAALTVRGDILTGAVHASTVYVQINGGGTLTFDATQNLAAQYGVRSFGDQYYGEVFGNGSSGSRCVITSNLAGGAKAGILQMAGASFYAGSTVLNYCDVSNMGDASTPMAYLVGDGFWAPSGNPFTATYSTFTNCGEVRVGAFVNLTITRSSFSGGLGSYDINLGTISTPHTASLTYNLFLLGVGLNLWPAGSTLTGNYIAANSAIVGDGSVTVSAANNLFLNTTDFVVNGAFTGNYFFENITGEDNAHFSLGRHDLTGTVSSSVFESPDDFSSDSGEAFNVTVSSSAPTTYILQNSIVLPSKTGQGVSELGAAVSSGGTTNDTMNYLHNTIFSSNGFGALDQDEGGATAATLQLESNIVYASASNSWKLHSLTASAPSTDACAPTACDYNAGFGTLSTDVSCSACTNQGNGYASKFTSTPGQHDLDILFSQTDPRFADTNRRLSTWDSLYLGNTRASWETSTSYSVGDLVSVVNSGVYGSLAINYRCITSHTSSASTKPDSGASWRADWEYASLYDIRTAILNSTTYIDGALPGCTSASPCDPIGALVAWVRRGFTPQHPLYRGRGHDGADIGAVPMDAIGADMAYSF